MNITEFRSKYPEYDDMSDDVLTRKLHTKYYSDMEYGDFSTRFNPKEESSMAEVAISGAGLGRPSRATIKNAGQAAKELVAAPVRTLESMTAGAIGGMLRMGAEQLQITPRIANNVARLGQITGKVPGDPVVVEHLIRKHGLDKPWAFYDRKIKKLAEPAKKISDFWNEQANTGWEAPNPDIVEARWRDRPVSKTVSAVSSGITSIGAVVGTTLLTKNPKLGLGLLAASETGNMYNRQRDKGTPVPQASKLALMAGAWTYVTEKIPFEKLMKPSARSIKSALKQSGWEGAQEVIEQIGHNLLEYWGYDYREPKNIPVAVKAAYDHMMDGWVDSLVGGIGAGGLSHVALHSGARPSKKEELISAAIRLKSGEVLTGATHADIIREAIAQGRNLDPEFDGPQGSGFMTNTGKFVKVLDEVDGKVVKTDEAWDIAKKADQVKQPDPETMTPEEVAALEIFNENKHLVAENINFPEPDVAKPPTVEEITKKPIEEIEPQTADHAIGRQYGLSNEEVDSKLREAELRYRELKLKETGEGGKVEGAVAPEDITLVDSHSDPQTMKGMARRGELKDGYHEGGDGYIYKVEGTKITPVPNMRASFDFKTGEFSFSEKISPKDVRQANLYHGTAKEAGLTLENLDTERSGQNFAGVGGNRLKGIYFTSIRSEAESYGDLAKKGGAVLEAKLKPNAKVIEESDFWRKHKQDIREGKLEEVTKQYDAIYRKDAVGEYIEVVVTNPKALLTPQQPTARTPAESEELAFLSRNRNDIEALLERETQPVAPPKIKRTNKNLLALGHKIKRDAGLSDEDYRDFAEIVTGKRSMAKMSRAERKEFVSALEESFGTPDELTPEDYDIPITVAGEPTSMRKLYNTAIQEIDELESRKGVPETVKIGSDKLGLGAKAKSFFFGTSNTPVYHLARILDGGKDGIFSRVLDKGIQHGVKIKDAHTRIVTEALVDRLRESGITNDDLAKMSKTANPRLQLYQLVKKGSATEVDNISINGKNYEMTMANLIDIYLMSNQADGIRHLTKGGLVINGVETGKLSEGQIDILRLKVEDNPRAKVVADTILEIGEQIWKPSINQVSNRLEGKDIAKVPNWWGLEVYMPKKLAGKTRGIGKLYKAVVNLLEDKGILKDRTKSNLPLIVRDALNRFNVFENAIAEYVGMAEPSRNSRTLINDPKIATMLELKGYSAIRDRILKIHERAQSVSAPEGDFSAFFSEHLPALYRAVTHTNPRLAVSQKTSTANYGAYVSSKYMKNIATGFTWKNVQRTLKLSDIAWNRFHMARSSIELGEMAESDAALRMWTGGKSSDKNKMGWILKVSDGSALADGMVISWDEYQDAKNGSIEGLSAEWWIDKNIEDLPDMDIDKWEAIQDAGEEASPEERQAAEIWKNLVTERAEYLWQRTQPSWDKWNRSVLTSEKGFRRLFLLFRSFHEKSLTIFNEAMLDYNNSQKTYDDKVLLAQKTGPVLAGYTINTLLRLTIMAAVTRKLKEPAKYLESFLTSWMGMFPIFGKVLQTMTNRFVDILSNTRPSYTGEAIDSYPVRVMNMVLKSPVNFTEAATYALTGDEDKAKDTFKLGMNRLIEGMGTLSGIPVPEIKRVLPDIGEEQTTRRGTSRTRKPSVRR